MGIVETSVLAAKDKRKEVLFWAEILGKEVNELIEEMPVLAKLMESR